ncbi:MAG: methyltransferase domain-containing protein [Gaiellaceae bacterium]
MSIHPWAAAGFGSAAEAYERGRPDYPAEAVAYLADRLDLRPGRTVVDLGAGTGKLSRLLAETGARVIAVEPVDEMRAFIEVEALAGTAEAIPLPDESADAVTAAQAFHWFDAEAALAEIDRILRPGGALALVANQLDRSDALTDAFAAVLDRYRGHASLETEPPSEAATFPHAQTLDAAGLAARLASETSIATLPGERRAEALDAVLALAPEPVTLRYVAAIEVRSKCGKTGGGSG